MSGGVDSCVAAALLKEQGYDVVGITMQLWNHANEGEERFDSCCSLTDVHDARLAAHQIGIPHYMVNYEREFRQGVVDYFAEEYASGRTPNPCVMCNSKLKFDHLIDRADALGAELVATGHYARIERRGDDMVLRRGDDPKKDQSYFLFNLKPRVLSRIMFPLADLTKEEVRAIAERHGIHTAKKHESQEICFVSGKRYTDFLEEHYPQTTGKPGDIVDTQGQVLGHHDGIHMFTVGQRKGIGVFGPKPLYVKAIDAETGRVTVCEFHELAVGTFPLEHMNWLGEDAAAIAASGDGVDIVIRYRSKPIPARITQMENDRALVQLATPAPWVTPGQAAVIYQGDRVLGGGFIGDHQAYQTRSQGEGVSTENSGRNGQTVGTDVGSSAGV